VAVAINEIHFTPTTWPKKKVEIKIEGADDLYREVRIETAMPQS
jgi:hypothetical protein